MFLSTYIYNIIGTIGLAFRKLIRGEKAIAKLEDINNRRDICFSCEFKTGKLKKYNRCTSCNCLISAKVIFTTSECPEDKWGALDY